MGRVVTAPSAPAVGWRREVVAGGLAALVMLPVEGSYGLIAFASLGPAYQSFAFASGVFAAVLSNVVAVLAGARSPVLAGSSAAIALLVASLLSSFVADPAFSDAHGALQVAPIASLVAVGIVLAGLLQMALAALRLGSIVST